MLWLRFRRTTRALDQAAPLAGWQLPALYLQLRRLLEARLKKHGSREYVQVLRLPETFAIDEVTPAIEDALELGTIGFDAVKICCYAGSNEDHLGSTWRTIRIFRWPSPSPR